MGSGLVRLARATDQEAHGLQTWRARPWRWKSVPARAPDRQVEMAAQVGECVVMGLLTSKVGP
jgi:hypothetical protein